MSLKQTEKAQISKAKMELRVRYSRLSGQLFSDNIPRYADWLEDQLASLSESPKEQSGKANDSANDKCSINGIFYKPKL